MVVVVLMSLLLPAFLCRLSRAVVVLAVLVVQVVCPSCLSTFFCRCCCFRNHGKTLENHRKEANMKKKLAPHGDGRSLVPDGCDVAGGGCVCDKMWGGKKKTA